ncbi:hypothetical protein ABZ023_34655 [Streptomyces sp. NPDC006367]|uniref:hypothetical protein n=1 Tax=unclassified Streptomyces TaxID=2593676 RepID=UPI0033B90CC3
MPITSHSTTTVTALGAEGRDQMEPVGKFCPRCERHALRGIECGHCGHVIITALAVEPCHPPAWSEGCCPVCFTTSPEVWEIDGRLRCTVCAEGRSRWGDRVKASPGWQQRARRVRAWVDEPGSMSYATEYAPEMSPRTHSATPVVLQVGQ